MEIIAATEAEMDIPRWYPRRERSKQEEYLMKRLGRTRKLFAFLRDHRHELFDDAFQEELESMYRTTGAGKQPVAPALMAMAVLLQGYVGASDAETVELTVVDLRWQLVLDRLGCTEPPFSQGALCDFRHRLIRADLDRRLLERTVELARRSEGFDPKKLPRSLRVAMDSAPLEGAGRVEDTINLLGHAARKIVECAARLLGVGVEEVCVEAGVPVLLASSVKRGLDIEWNDPAQKSEALNRLISQLESLQEWIGRRLADDAEAPPLKDHVETLRQLLAQDIEPDPDGGHRIRQGVAEDRRVSVEDPQMRHGRKSKSKRFNGFKRHIAADIDTGLILACAVLPANKPEELAAPEMRTDIERQGMIIEQLFIDRGYINSAIVGDMLHAGGDVVCKPWFARNSSGAQFTKSAFRLNMRDQTITCPAGEVQNFRLGMVVEFAPEACARCDLRTRCTMAAPGAGRTVSIADDEKLQQRLRKRVATRQGRERLRERVAVEHGLAHIVRRQGRRARYVGARKNLFDLRRASTIQNLETIHRKIAA